MRLAPLLLLTLTLCLAGCAAEESRGPKEVRLTVTDDGFVPAQLAVAKNEPVTLLVTRKTDRTCATSLVFSGGESHELPLDQVVRIELPATRPDTLRYTCPMDMYKGMIVSK